MSATQKVETVQELAALVETREVLEQLRPAADADVREWFEYHRHCAQTYVILAGVQTEPAHAHEVMRHAGQEMLRVREFQARIATN